MMERFLINPKVLWMMERFAAPGSGKTTLGIEFIRRFGNPTLILVPTVTIRQQWVDRIKQAFFK